MAEWILNGSASLTLSGGDAFRAPDQTNNSFRIQRGTAEGYINQDSGVTVEANVDYTFTLFVRATEDNQRAIIRLGESRDDNYVEVAFNLRNNSIESGPNPVGNNISNVLASIQEVGGNWCAVQIGFRFDRPTRLNMFVTTKLQDVAFLGDDSAASTLYFWNVQIERRRLREEAFYLGSSTNRRITTPDVSFTYIPIWRSETSSVSYKDNLGNPVSVDVRTENIRNVEAFDTADSVTYVQIPQSPFEGFPNEVTIYDNRGNQFDYNIDREDVYSKRERIQIVFLNRHGALETLWSTRRNTRSLDTNNETYYRNIVNFDRLNYNTTAHSTVKFNVISKNAITCDTAFLPESYNSYVEELFHSEYVWVNFNGETHAVILRDKQVSYKTHVNDKLVQYRFVFEYSNRIDNTIR